MASRYVEVSHAAFEAFLSGKGFARTVQGNEIVYVYSHLKNSALKIKVYTSLSDGASAARSCGKDSIKVCAVFDNGRKSFGIAKFPKVLRTGSEEGVLERVIVRAREAFSSINRFNREHPERPNY